MTSSQLKYVWLCKCKSLSEVNVLGARPRSAIIQLTLLLAHYTNKVLKQRRLWNIRESFWGNLLMETKPDKRIGVQWNMPQNFSLAKKWVDKLDFSITRKALGLPQSEVAQTSIWEKYDILWAYFASQQFCWLVHWQQLDGHLTSGPAWLMWECVCFHPISHLNAYLLDYVLMTKHTVPRITVGVERLGP